MSNRGKYFWDNSLLLVGVLLVIASFALSKLFVKDAALDSQARVIERYVEKCLKKRDVILNNAQLVTKLVNSEESLSDIQFIKNENYFFYIYEERPNQHLLRFWSSAKVLPDKNTLSGPDGSSFLKLPNGYYYIVKEPVKDHPGFTSYFLILIKYNFFLETEYLIDEFPFSRQLNRNTDLSFSKTDNPVYVNSAPAFYLKAKANYEVPDETAFSFILKILGITIIFFAVYLLCRKYFQIANTAKDVYLFLGFSAALRLILFFSRSLMNYNNFELFDPAVYGSSYFLPTLGDLLINSLLWVWVTIFVWNRVSTENFISLRHFNEKKRWIVGATAILALTIQTFVTVNVIRGLISDSKISFDVTNFFSLNVYSAVGFLILVCLSLGFYYFSRILFKVIFLVFTKKSFVVYLLILLSCILYFILFVRGDEYRYFLPAVLWLIVYTLIFHEEDRINRIIQFSVSGIVLWIFVFSISISMLMVNEIRKNELNQRRIYLEKLATLNDPASERLIDIGNKYLDSNFFFTNYSRFTDIRQARFLRDSIDQKNYIGYTNNYQTLLYFFDSTGRGVYNPSNYSVESLKNIVMRQSHQTSRADLFYYETGVDKYAYITERNINDGRGRSIGVVFIVSNPKKFEAVSLRPQLFRDYAQWNISNSSVYQYAIYNDNVLVSSSKRYPFVTSLVSSQLPKYRFELRDNGEYNEFWYRPSLGKVIVIARRNQNTLEAITLFSYIFCSFLFLLALTQIVSMVIGNSLNTTDRKRILLLPTIRGQIHGTFILITVVSFLVVGIATISFFITRYDNANSDRLSGAINTVLNQLQSEEGFMKGVYDLSGKADTVAVPELDSVVKSVSEIQGVDVNIYDLTGHLRVTSQPDVYSRGVLSTQIGPIVFYNLLRLRKIEQIRSDKISQLDYTSIYSPMRDKLGAPYGFVGVPVFASQQELNQEISTFLVTLINLNAFVFLLTGLVALLIANRVTRSFTIIGDKMKKISLSGTNEQIIWNRDDEIGTLVKEYNKMVVKLKDNVSTLAREEREEAWREMARQVAHEIKNPLTPMKLSLQYLQKAINEDSPNVQRLAASVSNNLVEQIDHLSKIAADFSQFANINKVDKQIFDLHDVIASVCELFKNNQNIQLEWKPLQHPITVLADKTQMNRVLANLLTNAVDAMADTENPKIDLKEEIDGFYVNVTVTDNGSGIPPELIPKIFTPNFTTKSSGTGLGLAMCKTIVERSGGEIWFGTEKGKGTSFHIRLPLIMS